MNPALFIFVLCHLNLSLPLTTRILFHLYGICSWRCFLALLINGWFISRLLIRSLICSYRSSLVSWLNRRPAYQGSTLGLTKYFVSAAIFWQLLTPCPLSLSLCCCKLYLLFVISKYLFHSWECLIRDICRWFGEKQTLWIKQSVTYSTGVQWDPTNRTASFV